MTVEELKEKKMQLESNIISLLNIFQRETALLVTGISITTVTVNCGEVIAGIRTEIKI